MRFSFGIIGCGKIAGQYNISNKFNTDDFTHAGAFSKYFDPIICLDKNILKAKSFKNKWNFKKYSNKLSSLKRNALDILIVATDTDSHYKILLEILKLKIKPKIVVCEKPLTNNYSLCKRIINLYKKKNIKLITNYQRRWDSKNLVIKTKIVKNSFFGQFRSGYCCYSKGALNTSSHLIDLFLLFFGDLKIIKFNAKYFSDYLSHDKTKPFALKTKDNKIIYFLPTHYNENKNVEIKLFFAKKILETEDACISWSTRDYVSKNILKYEKSRIKNLLSFNAPSVLNLAKIIYDYLNKNKYINFTKYNLYDIKIHQLLSKL